jgi:hypothetical protein
MKKLESSGQPNPPEISAAEIIKQTGGYAASLGLLFTAEMLALSQVVDLGEFSHSFAGMAVSMGLLLADHFPAKRIALRKTSR